MTKTCSAKKRDSVGPAMIGPPSIRSTSGPPMQRHAAENGGADAEAPVGVLIEAQHLSGERHAEGEQEQEDADDPGELARKLIGAEEKDLCQVNEHDGDHEVGAPAVHGAQKPAELDVVVEELKAAPRVAGRGSVDQREQDAGHHLQDEDAPWRRCRRRTTSWRCWREPRARLPR